MSNEIQNPVKRKLIKEEKDESSKQLDKSMHLLRICDEFAGELRFLHFVPLSSP